MRCCASQHAAATAATIYVTFQLSGKQLLLFHMFWYQPDNKQIECQQVLYFLSRSLFIFATLQRNDQAIKFFSALAFSTWLFFPYKRAISARIPNTFCIQCVIYEIKDPARMNLHGSPLFLGTCGSTTCESSVIWVVARVRNIAIRCCFFFIPALISSPLLHNKIKKHKSSYIELHIHDHSSLVNWLFIVCARCCCVDLSRPDRGIGSLLCHRRAHKWMAIFISQFVTQSISFANCVSNCDVRV